MPHETDPLLAKLVAYVRERASRTFDELHRDVAPALPMEAFRTVVQEACAANVIERVGTVFLAPGGLGVEDTDLLLARIASDVDRLERKVDALAALLAGKPNE